jgi:DNA polymerase IV
VNGARVILHADMDAFYASVEQHDDPTLRGRPLIVGGTGGRGVVAAASYEVRRFGVRSAMPMRRALQLCPAAVVRPPRFARYQAVSREVFAVFHEFTPLVEGLSLDEAFLDVTHSQQLLGDGPGMARAIKARVRERTGLTISVGVAANKLVAKIASDLDKPDGLTVVAPGTEASVLAALPVKRLPGLGRKKGEELVAAGLQTLGELQQAEEGLLRRLFGADASRMRQRACGMDDRPVVPERDGKSVSAETTFDQDVADPGRLRAELLALADKTSARLRAKGLAAGTVWIKVRQHDFVTITRQQRLLPPTHDSQRIGHAAAALLAQWLAQHPGARLRLLGVGSGDFAGPLQPDLFGATDDPGASSSAVLDEALDQIRRRFGGAAVRRAGTLPGQRRS